MSQLSSLTMSPAGRRIAVACLTLPAVALLFSCHLGCPDSPRDDPLKLFSVQVPAEPDLEGYLPPEFRLREGEVVHSQSCSITRDGQFTFTRTIEAEVGYLGAELNALSVAAAEVLEIEAFSGVLVRSIESDGPAGRAGIGPDDVILRFGDEPVRSLERLQYLAERTAPGTSVEVEFLQKGKKVTASVVLGKRTQIVRSKSIQRDLPVLDDMDRSGLKLVEIPPDLRNLAGERQLSPTGLLVTQVLPGGPAFFSRLHTRDFIVSLEDQSINTIAEYRAAVGSIEVGSRVGVVARRDEERIETTLKLASDARGRSEFDVLGLIEYQGRPHYSRFELLWGLLCNFSNCHSIHEDEGKSEHRTETKWGLVLDLLRYHGTPDKKTLRFAWILPISFGA